MAHTNYDALSDEMLVKLSAEGDLIATEYILARYKNLVRSRARMYFLAGADKEDLIQEGMIGLFKAIRDYDESKEASFYHFAELCINRQIYSAIEASNRKKHAPLNSYISFYSDSNEDGVAVEDLLGADFLSNPEEVVIAQESQEILLQKLRAKLSKFEQNVLDDYLSGMNYQQIAEKMGKSPKAIDNALQRIKGKMK